MRNGCVLLSTHFGHGEYERVRKMKRGLFLLSVSLCLQSCDYLLSKDRSYSKYGSYGFLTIALTSVSDVQLREYIEDGKVSSSFDWNVHCFETYSIFSESQPNVVVNVVSQSGCDETLIERYIHKIFLPENPSSGMEVVEVLCDSTGYSVFEIDSLAVDVGWVEGEPVCPSGNDKNAPVPEYRRYSVRSELLQRPDFEQWVDES